MKIDELKNISRQLSCPTGEQGIIIGNNMNEANALITTRSIDNLKPINKESIIEIGLGNGLLSKRIIELVGEDGNFIGIEKSHVLAQQARKLFCGNGETHITIHSSDYNKVNIVPYSIDGILAVNLLYFIDDMDLFFQKLYYWLKPHGRIVIAIRSSHTLKKIPFTQFYFNLRAENEIINSMSNAGFIDINSEYYDEGVIKFNELELPVDALIIKGLKN
ncbi:MAG: class I SAM-dependent methyltransferase [Gammaproteobacteria bacterium]|nr:class I SAM-dependent methyltransferase [Gammaproteobacteria bacterium]